MKPLAIRDKGVQGMTQQQTELVITPEIWSAIVSGKITETQVNNRLIAGIKRCSKMLQKHPEKVLSCVIPMDSTGTSHLFILMIKSLCNTIGIPVVKVDSSAKLGAILNSKQNEMAANCDCALMLSGADDQLFLAAMRSLWESEGNLPVAMLP